MRMRKKFKVKYLKEELELPECAIEDRIVSNLRWSSVHEIIFKDKDETFWRGTYSCGLTELQDEKPWEYEEEIECEQVELKEVIALEWIPVDKEEQNEEKI